MKLMIKLEDSVMSEYERWRKIIGPEDPYVSSKTIGIHDALRAHFLLIDFFLAEGRGIGGVGPRDINLLHSALSRQTVGFGSQDKWDSKYEIAGTLLYGLIMDHPFHDANKRTAILCTLHLLEKVGRYPTITEYKLEKFTVEVAEHAIKNRKRYKALKKKGEHDVEVKFIAKYLKQNTRNIDKKEHTITYRELKTILNKYNYNLESPKGNYIDIVKITQKRFLLKPGKLKEIKARVGRVGFPGWTTQVLRQNISYVRKKTKLDLIHGIDSQVFYEGIDGLQHLIAKYQGLLRRLAYL